MSFHVPEQYRVERDAAGRESSSEDGNNGAFRVHLSYSVVFVIASDGMGWEHVSVSHSDHVPSWGEMQEIKTLFWDDEDCVVQFHPPKSLYKNLHPYCLHLWRPTNQTIPQPDRIMV